MERHFQEINFFRMLEEAVCTLKEQVNIYEQEVDQVIPITIMKLSQVLRNIKIFYISDQRTIENKGVEL